MNKPCRFSTNPCIDEPPMTQSLSKFTEQAIDIVSTEDTIVKRKMYLTRDAHSELKTSDFKLFYKKLGIAKSTAYGYIKIAKMLDNYPQMRSLPFHVLGKCAHNKELREDTRSALSKGEKVDITYFENNINV